MTTYTQFATQPGVDVNDAGDIEILITRQGTVYVNVDGRTLVRAYASKEIVVKDYRNNIAETD